MCLLGITTLGQGGLFGEAALLSGRPRTATITAATATDCLELTREALDTIVEKNPEDWTGYNT